MGERTLKHVQERKGEEERDEVSTTSRGPTTLEAIKSKTKILEKKKCRNNGPLYKIQCCCQLELEIITISLNTDMIMYKLFVKFVD